MTERKKMWLIFSVFALTMLLVLIFALLRLQHAQKKLGESADMIESIGNSRFNVEALVTDTIPVSTYITIPISIPVQVSMSMTFDAPIHMNVPVNKSLMIPFSIDISQIIPVDTLFNFPDKLNPLISDTLDMATKMKIKFWPGFKIPFHVEGQVPLQQNLSLDMQTVRVSANIPIAMSINDSIPVRLDFELPVNETVSMPLKINTRATITFIEKIPIEADFPIQLKAPVEVDFGKTPMKAKFDSLARMMREVL